MTVRTYSVKDKTGKNDKYFKLFVSVASISTCEQGAAPITPIGATTRPLIVVFESF